MAEPEQKVVSFILPLPYLMPYLYGLVMPDSLWKPVLGTWAEI